MLKIAVLLTCHNRQKKTETCLKSLQASLKQEGINKTVQAEIFLTDDGCTDDTVQSARSVYPDEKVLHILQGDGNLFWAGGMRFCWREAMKRHNEWDYYLLLNDDTELMTNVFGELFGAENHIREKYGLNGIVSGITCATDNPNKLTYGGDVWKNKFLATRERLKPIGKPQMCDFTNANILLVPKDVVDKIGIFFEGYQHGKADFDYSNMARKAGIPVVLTANFCGYCNFDHIDMCAVAKKVTRMTLKQRKAYFESPLHSISDYLCFVRRTSPIRLPFVWLGRMMNLYFPKLYYRISGNRF